MYSAEQIAKWFIDKSAAEVKNGGEYLTQLKLQKLLYYAKGFFYVFENEPLFEEEFKAQKFGPVLQSVANVVSKYKREPIKSEFKDVKSIQDKNVLNFLEFIYKNIASVYAAKKLVEFTHNERPWKETEEKHKIDDNLICSYFRDTYLSDTDSNANDLPVSDEKLFLALSDYNVSKFNKAYKVLAQ
jgi:uncharacterized phage-associated protein